MKGERVEAVGRDARLQRGEDDPRDRPPGAGGPRREGDPDRGRRLDRRHAGDPARDGRKGRRARLPPAPEPGEGSGGLRRIPLRRGRRRRGAGRGPGVRPPRVRQAPAADRRGTRRRRLWIAVSRRRRAPRPLFLAHRRQSLPDARLQHGDEPEPDRHGDLLQDVPPRGRAVHDDRVAALRHRAGDHREGGAPRIPRLRGADLLLRPHVRRGEEDRLEGRLLGSLDDHQAPLSRGGGIGQRRARHARAPGEARAVQPLAGGKVRAGARPPHPGDRRGLRQPDAPPDRERSPRAAARARGRLGRRSGRRRIPQGHVPRQSRRPGRVVPFSADGFRAGGGPRPLDRHDRLLQRARAHRGRPRDARRHARHPAAGRAARPPRAGALLALRHRSTGTCATSGATRRRSSRRSSRRRASRWRTSASSIAWGSSAGS